jgi:hypothetical protein
MTQRKFNFLLFWVFNFWRVLLFYDMAQENT